MIEDSEKGNDLYRKSHGSYAPGEQKHRGYDWNIDPNTAVFGAKGKMIAFNGVSSNTSDVLHGRLDDLKTERTVNMKKVSDCCVLLFMVILPK